MPRSSREKSTQTRQKILEAAYQAFVENGYNATPMRMISERAGVTVGALYNHFQTKEDIWREVLLARHPYREIFTFFHTTEGETIADYVRLVARGMVNELRKRPDLLNLMFIEIVEFGGRHIPELAQSILPGIIELQGVFANRHGKLRQLPQPILARSFAGLFFSYYVTEILLKRSGGFVLDDTSLDQFVDLYLYGILEEDSHCPERTNDPQA